MIGSGSAAVTVSRVMVLIEATMRAVMGKGVWEKFNNTRHCD